MAEPEVIQAQYEQLESIAQRFAQLAESNAEMSTRLRQKVEALMNGGWEGEGSEAFRQEMYSGVLPATSRFTDVLQQNSQVLRQIVEIFQEAERDAVSLFSYRVNSNAQLMSASFSSSPSMALGANLNLNARQAYREAIEHVAQYGMPVRFLQAVERDYTFIFGGEDVVRPWINLASFERDTLADVKDVSPGGPIDMLSGLGNFYHESVHAYFDLREDDRDVSEIIQRGIAYYRNAPLDSGGHADGPERLFQEAAATYVQHRASNWWHTFDLLTRYAEADNLTPNLASQHIERIRNEYNSAMAERAFGYQPTGGFLGFGTRESYTTRNISPELRNFLDQRILEGKIPDNFDNIPAFQELITKIRERSGQRG